MSSGTQYGRPLLVGGLDEIGAVQGLHRLDLRKSGYNERWLQRLIMRHPNLLPIEQIEPALIPAIPICMEMPVPSGYIDNLYSTPAGDLIVVETKLFRNPEARREVVGQIIDYAKDLSAWNYDDLECGIQRAEPATGNRESAGPSLFKIVAAECGDDPPEEVLFIDTVSRNLSRGRFLLLIVGDGIQYGTESIADFLQQHAGLHFTLGLVELAIFELPRERGAGYLVQPRILARTTNIDRGIVTIENDKIAVRPPIASATKGVAGNLTRRTTISEEKFYEELESRIPGVSAHLRNFIDRLESIGVTTEFGASSLILRWRPDERRAWNLGSITKEGKVWTELLNGQADAVGQIGLAHEYLERIAQAVPGAYVKRHPKETSWYVAKGNTYVMIGDLLDNADGWYSAIESFTREAQNALKNQ